MTQNRQDPDPQGPNQESGQFSIGHPVEADPDALSPDDARPAAPEPNKGSGQYAVFDHDLGNFVSGVSDKATADKARKDLESHNGAITDDHRLSTIEV